MKVPVIKKLPGADKNLLEEYVFGKGKNGNKQQPVGRYGKRGKGRGRKAS